MADMGDMGDISRNASRRVISVIFSDIRVILSDIRVILSDMGDMMREQEQEQVWDQAQEEQQWGRQRELESA